QAMQRRVPLFLMPRDPCDKRKKEFRISSCTVHHTGVYLLQESDAKLLDGLLAGGVDQDASRDLLDAPLVPAPPREVQDLDDRLQELLKEIPAENAQPMDISMDTPAHDDVGQVVPLGSPRKDGREPVSFGGVGGVGALRPSAGRIPLPAAHDPWALLDEHQSLGGEVPLEVGKTSKRVNAKKLLMNAEGLPDAGALAARADDDLWSAGGSSASLAPLLAAGNPVESLFLAVAGHLKSGGRYETQKAAFSAVWLEFEDLFSAALGKRRVQKMLTRGKNGAPGTPPRQDDEGSDDEGGANPMTPSRAAVTPAADLDGPTTPGANCTKLVSDLSEEKQRQEDQRREVAMLENMIQDAQQKYESTIRQHLQMLQKDSVDTDSRKFPQLYANVRRWQDQLEPVLKDCEARPEFDIHNYSTKFLKKMTSVNTSETEAIPFSRLVHGQPRWEVCRRFLTCLLLTNEGNTDIVVDGEEDRQNTFGVKLLQAERKMISLETEAKPLAAPTEGGSKRKAVAPSAVPTFADTARPTKQKRVAPVGIRG
ncbi:unnamed protein product, partial [Polarella glacialis]